MTKLLLPKMLEKKRGIVVNLSSSAGAMNMPMNMVYSATKVSGCPYSITCQRIIIWYLVYNHVCSVLSIPFLRDCTKSMLIKASLFRFVSHCNRV